MLKTIFAAVASVAVLMLAAACDPVELEKNYIKAKQAAQVMIDVICDLPEDGVVRAKIRKGFAEIGLDSSQVCEKGLPALLEGKDR